MAYIPPRWQPTPESGDPGATLDDNPCTSLKCCSLHEQLAFICFLMAAYTSSGTLAQILTATKQFRGLSETDIRNFMIASFTSTLRDTATSDAMKEWNRLSDQKLKEIFAYLWKIVFQVP